MAGQAVAVRTRKEIACQSVCRAIGSVLMRMAFLLVSTITNWSIDLKASASHSEKKELSERGDWVEKQTADWLQSSQTGD